MTPRWRSPAPAPASTLSEANNCGVSVNAGQSCQINISFAPTTIGNLTGTLTVTDNAPGGSPTVSLAGTGVADSIGPAYTPLSGLSSSTTPGGSAAMTTIQVGGAGMTGTVNVGCSGLPQGASCAFSPSTVTMRPNAPTQAQLIIYTTARSLLLPIGVITALLLFTVLIGLSYFKGTSTSLTPRVCRRLVPVFALAICACGGGSGSSPSGGSSSSNATPAGNYTVVITATTGSAAQT